MFGDHKKATIMKNDSFDVREAAQLLWRAVDGIGTDEDSIINIVSSCNNAQRQELKREFTILYQKDEILRKIQRIDRKVGAVSFNGCRTIYHFQKDLMKELKSEMKIRFSVDFKQLLFALFKRPNVYDAILLKAATKGLGTNERLLVEILLTRTTKQMEDIRDEYFRKFKVNLEDDVADDTSGDFRKFSYTLSRGKRKSCFDALKAKDDSAEIYSSYKRLKGTDNPRFDFIGLCCCESYQQLKRTFEEYRKLTGDNITTLIEKEFSGDTEEGLKWVVKCAKGIPDFFAERLHKCMEGLVTDHEALVRIIVTRSEVDLALIKYAYQEKYGKTLESKVKSSTKGFYKRLLIAILRGNNGCETS